MIDIEREQANDLISRGLVKPMTEAPLDGTMLRLLVLYDPTDVNSHPVEDSCLAWTIGFNNFDDNGIVEWNIAGWNWEQDCFTQSSGEPLAWLPFEPVFPEDR